MLHTLVEAGFEAYLVGGGVRDLLAGLKPKDFDIATSAHPEEIKTVFGRSCRLIGRRFLIAHVRVGGLVTEVTTFRGAITDSHERDETGRILSDNVYGTLETDARRRDFAVNALYYDIRDFSVLDFADGLGDLRQRTLRMIGEPELRYREDPVRMLRALRIANKLGFSIEPATAEPVRRLAPLLGEIPPARLFDEVLKMLLSSQAPANLDGLREHGLFGILFPDTETALAEDTRWQTLLRKSMANTAWRVDHDQPVTPAFLYAALLWPPVALRAHFLAVNEGCPPMVALTQATHEVLARQTLRVALPKRYSVPAREIWLLQPRFDYRRGGRVRRLLAHPRFRAAYDFLALRADSAEPQLAELAQWWTQAQAGGEPPPPPAEAQAPGDEASTRRRRRRGGRRRRAAKKPQD